MSAYPRVKRVAIGLAELVLLTVTYAATALAGLSVDAVNEFAAVVWPPSGIAVATLILRGTRLWPGVTLGALAVNLWIGASVPTALAIALGNTLEAFVVAFVLLRFLRLRSALDRTRDVVGLTVMAIAGSLVSASVGVAALHAAGTVAREEVGRTWGAWWCGDAVGIILVSPAILTITSKFHRPPRSRGALAAEATALALLLSAACWLIFARHPWEHVGFLRPHLLFPLLLWPALRFGPKGAARGNVALGAASLAAFFTTVHPGTAELDRQLMMHQLYLAVASTTTLACASVVAQLALKTALLGKAQEELEATVQARTRALSEANAELLNRDAQLERGQSLFHIGSFEWSVTRNELSFSDELHQIFGIPKGTPLRFEDVMGRIHPEDRVAWHARLEGTILTLRPSSGEERIVRPDGTVRVLQSQTTVAVGGAEGLRILATCQDITERRLAEATRAQLAAIVESSGDGILSTSFDGTIETWNRGAERIFGYSAAEAIGRPASLFVPADRTSELEHATDRIRDGQWIAALQTVWRRRDGTWFDASVTFSPLFDPSGNPSALSVILRDVTVQRRAEEEKVVLLREIHHRVKNNLQVIASLLNLQATGLNGRDIKAVFDESQNRVHAIALVHALLHESESLAQIQLEDYLRRLVARICQTYKCHSLVVTANAPGIDLDLDTAVPCGLVVNELVSNALRHAFPDGRSGKVTIFAGVDADGQVELTVRDDGVGLPADVSLAKPASLGFQIVIALARQLRGSFRVETAGGTVAVLRFPSARRSVAPNGSTSAGRMLPNEPPRSGVTSAA